MPIELKASGAEEHVHGEHSVIAQYAKNRKDGYLRQNHEVLEFGRADVQHEHQERQYRHQNSQHGQCPNAHDRGSLLRRKHLTVVIGSGIRKRLIHYELIIRVIRARIDRRKIHGEIMHSILLRREVYRREKAEHDTTCCRQKKIKILYFHILNVYYLYPGSITMRSVADAVTWPKPPSTFENTCTPSILPNSANDS